MGTYFIGRYGKEEIKQRILIPAIKGEKIAQISKSRTIAAAVLGILRKTFRTLSDRSSLKVS
jgi:hypothetical protein